MKQKLIASLTQRIKEEIEPQCAIKYLKKLDVETILDSSIVTLYLYTRSNKKQKIIMAEVITAMGHSIRNKFKLPRNSGHAAKTGAFVLYSFELLGIIKTFLGQAANNHQTILIELTNEDILSELWENLNLQKTEKLPSLEPYAPWTSTKHATGAIMVKTQSKEVLSNLTPESHPIVYNTLNKAQEIGWIVNEFVFPIFNWALRNKADAFKSIWEIQNNESRNSKIREAKAVSNIASRFIGKTFYHLYYFDFRGRKYPATAFFHEQGTDGSKGLLLLAEKKPIGEQGFFWLLISIANYWAGSAGREDGYKTDKIPLNDRVNWSLDNEEIFLSYAENPKINQGWMQADSPWQFLAACNELKKARDYESLGNNIFDYESGLVCYIDGSNNGSQHLSALTKDEITAPHVNLIPSELPGDLYSYVAEHVWKNIENQIEKISKKKIEECEKFIDNFIDLKKQINEAPQKSDRRKELIDEIKVFKKKNERILDESAPIFWNRIKDNKEKRKICKRGVMTIPL